MSLRLSKRSAVLMTSGDCDHGDHDDHHHHPHHHQTGGCDNMKQTEFWFSLAVCLDMAPAAAKIHQMMVMGTMVGAVMMMMMMMMMMMRRRRRLVMMV